MHRNKAVKELSGFYAWSEQGAQTGSDADTVVEATREDLELAKLVLARFLPVVIVDEYEMFNYTLNQATRMMFPGSKNSWYLDPGSSQKNINKKNKTEMSDAARKKAEQLNSLDMELYYYALEKISESLEGLGQKGSLPFLDRAIREGAKWLDSSSIQ